MADLYGLEAEPTREKLQLGSEFRRGLRWSALFGEGRVSPQDGGLTIGLEVDPGDQVLVHNAPTHIPFGTQRTYASRATVQRASWLRRQFVKLTGGTELYELYDVGFEG